jgi:hypothetical protein
MEILESTLWVALGFVPTLASLEIYDRLRKRTKKEISAVIVKAPVPVLKPA